MSNLIERQAAIDAVYYAHGTGMALKAIKQLPSAQPEVKEIGYAECANAMLKMWMDNVVTDGEYNRIMDKLNTHWRMKHE